MHKSNWFKWCSRHAAGPGDWIYDYIICDPFDAEGEVLMWVENLADTPRYQTDGFRGFDYELINPQDIPEEAITRMVTQTGDQINRLTHRQDVLLEAYWACQKPVD